MPPSKGAAEGLEQIKNLVGAGHYLDSYEDRLCYSYDSTIEEAIPDAICFPGSAADRGLISKYA